MILSRVKFSESYCPRCWILLKDVPLLSYKYRIIFGKDRSGHSGLLMLRGGFLYDYSFVSKEKKISSNHDTSVLIVFIFSHNMALFLLSFFFSFFVPSSQLLLSVVSVATNSRGHIQKGATHASFGVKALSPFDSFFCEKKNHVDGLIFNINNIGTQKPFVLSEFFQFWQIFYCCFQ